MTRFHFLNVGQGSMVMGVFPDGSVLVYDCNITDENEQSVCNYLSSAMPQGKNNIDVFVNSHRDADHMRGIMALHSKYPIHTIWDSGVPGNDITSSCYIEYMNVRNSVPHAEEVTAGLCWSQHKGVSILNGKRTTLCDSNSQSIVLHINDNGSSLMLAGDTCASTWSDYIVPEKGTLLNSLVLYASHHGSRSFFNEDPDKCYDYTGHMEVMRPAITLISVGANNQHGHPDDTAIQQYENYCHGTVDTGQKIFRTDLHGTMMLDLHGAGTGTIYWNRI